MPRDLAISSVLLGLCAATASAQQPLSYLEATRLLAPNGMAFDVFGHAVGFDGTTAAISAPGADLPGGSREGIVFLYEVVPGGWRPGVETYRVTTPGAVGSVTFGRALDIDGGVLVVGAQFAGAGIVYLFERPSGGWADLRSSSGIALTPTAGQDDDLFGSAVAVRGDLVVVGSLRADVNGLVDPGAAYVYEKPAGGWVDMTEDRGPVGEQRPPR